MKVAAYAGTRNLYPDMVTAAKSLTKNSSVDIIYFLIEDSVFPEKLPDHIKCIDVSDQKFFRFNGPNVYELWTYMTLMRATYPKLFPQYDKLLSLDVDTIVDRNIDELWDINMNGYYMAGVAEPTKSKKNDPYINVGVTLFNLKKIREDCMDDSIIYSLNTTKYKFAEQDCMNKLFKGKILTYGSMYNANDFTPYCKNPKVIHFANKREWNTEPIVLKYKNMEWKDLRS